MKKRYLIAGVILFAYCAVFAQGVPGEIKAVVSIGVGATQKEAETAAIRSAVMTAVGEFIDAETLVENGKLVNDKILSYSSGYVESYKQIGPARALEGGLMEIKILAQVRRTVLQEKVRGTIKTSAKVDGNSLFAELLTKQDQLSDAKEMVASVFKDFPLKVLEARVEKRNDGKPKFSFDAQTGEVLLDVRVGVNKTKYNGMLKEIINKIEPLASRKVTLNRGSCGEDFFKQSTIGGFGDVPCYRLWSAADFEIDKLVRGDATGGRLLVIGSIARRNARLYIVNEKIWQELLRWFTKGYGNPFMCSIVIELMGRDGEVIGDGTFLLGKDVCVDRSGVVIGGNCGREEFLIVTPLVEMGLGTYGHKELLFAPSRRRTAEESIGKHGHTRMDGTDEIITISLGNLDPEVLKKAVRLECRLELKYADDEVESGTSMPSLRRGGRRRRAVAQ